MSSELSRKTSVHWKLQNVSGEINLIETHQFEENGNENQTSDCDDRRICFARLSPLFHYGQSIRTFGEL